MQFGLLISILLHVVILGGALFSIQLSRPELRLPESEPVAVGMISPGEATKVKQGVRTAKLLEAAEAKESPNGDVARKEATRPKMASTAPPPPPPPPPEEKAEPPPPKAVEAPPPPPPIDDARKKQEAEQQKLAAQKAAEQKAAEQKAAEEKQRIEEQAKAAEAEALKRAEEQKLAEEKKIAEERKLAEEKKAAEEEQKRLEEQRRQAELKKKRDAEKKRLAELKKKKDAEKKRLADEAAKKQSFSDKMSALLNKIPDAAPPPPSTAGEQPTKAKGPTLGAPEGKDRTISASEAAMMKAEISTRLRPCWRIPSGGGGSDTPVVTLRWRLNRDGTLDGDPWAPPEENRERPRDALFRLAVEAAERAVKECAPFDLPPERYNFWRTITWDFDPSKML